MLASVRAAVTILHSLLVNSLAADKCNKILFSKRTSGDVLLINLKSLCLYNIRKADRTACCINKRERRVYCRLLVFNFYTYLVTLSSGCYSVIVSYPLDVCN